MIRKIPPITPSLVLCALLACFSSGCGSSGDSFDPFFWDNSDYNNYYADPDALPYRTGSIDGYVRTVPASIMNNIFTYPAVYLPQLVDYLGQDGANDYALTRRIHDWIADNIAYDVGAYCSGSYPSQSAESVLVNKKGVCAGYANLFNRMMELAMIESEVVSGDARGYLNDLEGHAWNAVHLNDRWYLVDVTWDAGYVQGSCPSMTFVKEYESDYLFLAPAGFVNAHLPDEPEYQFLNPPVPEDGMLRMPYYYGSFFTYRLGIAGGNLAHTMKNLAGYRLEVECPADTYMFATIYTTGWSEVTDVTPARQANTNYLFNFNFSAYHGTRYVLLYARKGSPSGTYDGVAFFEVINE